jgi:hypothetical protein
MQFAKITLLFILTNFVCISLYSQPKDVVYIDAGFFIGGTSATFGIGLNYERMLNNNISIRAGVNLVTAEGRGTNLMMGFPVSVQFFTSADNRLEGGIGSGAAFNIKGHVEKNVFPGLVLRAGYRYQKRDGEGKFIKVGLEFPSNLYFSIVGLGYSK